MTAKVGIVLEGETVAKMKIEWGTTPTNKSSLPF